MHRHVEIGLSILLGLMVSNSAEAAPRDERFVLKGHGAGAASARTTTLPTGRPSGAVQRGFIAGGAYGHATPGSRSEAARGGGSAAGAAAYDGYVGGHGYSSGSPGASHAWAPLDADAARRGGGFATGREAYGYAGPPPGGYAVGPGRGFAGGFATGREAYGYAGPPPGGYAVAPGRGFIGGFATTRTDPYAAGPGGSAAGVAYPVGPAYGYASEPTNGYPAVPGAGYVTAGQTCAAPVHGYANPRGCCSAVGPIGYVTDRAYSGPYSPDPIFGYLPVIYPW